MSWHSLCYILHGNISVYFDGTGNREHFDALKVYLLSRSISRLKNEFQAGNGKVNLQLLLNFFQNTCSSCLKLPLFLQITVDFIEGFPPIDLQLGKHVFLSTGDFYLATRSWFFFQASQFWVIYLFFYCNHFTPGPILFVPTKQCMWFHLPWKNERDTIILNGLIENSCMLYWILIHPCSCGYTPII